MSRRALCGIMAAFAIAAALSAPASALAVAAPAAGGTLDLQAWTETGTLVVVTAITVPPSTPLPTTVRIPVPAEAQVQWTGEVLGGDPSADPSRSYKILKSPAGGQYAEFTIETTRSAQVDSYLPVLKTDGAKVSAAFDWIQSVSSPAMTFSVRVPPKATNVVITPKPSSAPDFNDAGEALYAGDSMVLKPGSKKRVSLSYSTAPSTGSTTTAGADTSALLYFVVALLVIVVVILVVVIARQGGVAPQEPAPARRKRPAPSTPAGSKSDKPGKPDAVKPANDDSDAWGFDDSDD